MTSKLLLLILFFISFTTLAGFDTTQRLHRLISIYHQLEQFNGVALVAHKDQILLHRGYGQANVEWDIPHTIKGKFKLASITKQFTAVLILQLAEQGKVQLTDTISEHLPDYRQDTGKQITIWQLLTHTSGLANFFHLPSYKDIESRNPYDLKTFIAQFCSEDLLFKPGSQFRYSNAGYTILGSIIETVTGKPYSKVAQERIFQPLGMHNSGVNGQYDILSHRVSGYQRTLTGLKHAEHIDMSIPYSAGSIYSTSEDLFLWHRALADDTLLSEPWRKKLYTVTRHRNYAAGWLVDKLDTLNPHYTVTKVHHGGGIQGFNASIARILEDDYLIVLLNNTGGAPMTEMTTNLLKILYGKTTKKPQPRFTQQLFQILSQQGVEAALSWYHKEVEKNNGYSERGLNRFANQLLEVNHVEAAIAFLMLNVSTYPTSAKAHFALAEAYQKIGDIKQAKVIRAKANKLTNTPNKATK